MFITVGFRTSSIHEVPVILYLGDDGATSLEVAEKSDFPRVARIINPPLFPVRHWSEEAALAFEQSHASKTGPLQFTPNDVDNLQVIGEQSARIQQLQEICADQNAAIEKLKSELAAALPKITTAPETTSPAAPDAAAGEESAQAAAGEPAPAAAPEADSSSEDGPRIEGAPQPAEGSRRRPR